MKAECTSTENQPVPTPFGMATRQQPSQAAQTNGPESPGSVRAAAKDQDTSKGRFMGVTRTGQYRLNFNTRWSQTNRSQATWLRLMSCLQDEWQSQPRHRHSHRPQEGHLRVCIHSWHC